MTIRSTPHLRAAFSLGVAAAIALLGCEPGQQAADSNRQVYKIVGSEDSIVRLDTRNGEVWRTPISGDGGWQPFAEGRSDSGLPERIGRYTLLRRQAPGGQQSRGAKRATQFVLLDGDTGRTWLASGGEKAVWALIADPTSHGDGDGAPAPAASAESAPMIAPPTRAAAMHAPVAEGKVDLPRDRAVADVEGFTKSMGNDALPLEIRLWTIAQLGRYPADLSVDPLLQALENDDPEIVAAAIDALAKVGDPSTIPQILKLARHPDPRVQAAVNRTVGETR
jgi:hypothetical protein